jgi:prevent-host-death family protein
MEMPRTVNLYEAKTKLSELVDRAAAGEEIVIAKAGKPKARLVPIAPARPKRKPGVWKGKVWIADDFDAPLPPDVLADFDGHK